MMAVGVVATYNGSYHSPGFDITVSGLGGFDRLTIERVDAAGEYPDTPVRGADGIAITGSSFAVTDYEAPVGRETIYRATAVTDVLRDLFDRSVSNGWGIGTSGKLWTPDTSVPSSDFSVASGVGQHSLGTINVSRITTTDVSLGNFEATFSTRSSASASGAHIAGGLVSHYIDMNNHYRWEVWFGTSGSLEVKLRKVVGGSSVLLVGAAIPVSYTAGGWYHVRCQMVDGQMRMRAWAGTEPTGWQVTSSDTALAAGRIGFLSLLGTGNTNTLPVVVSYDNLVVHAIGGEPVDTSVGTSSPIGIQDTFSRTVTPGWGTPDIGATWGVRSGPAGDYSVPSGVGRTSMSTRSGSGNPFGLDYVMGSPLNHSDIDQRVRARASVMPAGDVLRFALVARETDRNNWWELEANASSTGEVRVRMGRQIAGAGWYTDPGNGDLVPGVTFAPGAWIWLRMQAVGSVLRGKVWADGATEPTGWQIEVVDTSHPTGSYVGLKAFSSVFSSNPTPEIVEWDNYSLTILDSTTVIPIDDPGTTWLKSVGQPALSRRVNISRWDETSRPGRVLGEYEVLGRRNKVILTDVLGGREGTIALATFRVGDIWQSDSSLRDLELLLDQGGTLLLQVGGRDVTGEEDMYLAVTSMTRRRVGVVGGDFAHLIELGFIETDRPWSEQQSLGLRSWSDVLSQNASWVSVLDNHSTWLDLLQRDL